MIRRCIYCGSPLLRVDRGNGLEWVCHGCPICALHDRPQEAPA